MIAKPTTEAGGHSSRGGVVVLVEVERDPARLRALGHRRGIPDETRREIDPHVPEIAAVAAVEPIRLDLAAITRFISNAVQASYGWPPACV